MVGYRLPTKFPGECVMPAVNGPAFGYEVTVLQQLWSIFLEKTLDRSRPAFMRARVDIANTFAHLRNYTSQRGSAAIVGLLQE
jgi:hypothetical protein